MTPFLLVLEILKSISHIASLDDTGMIFTQTRKSLNTNDTGMICLNYRRELGLNVRARRYLLTHNSLAGPHGNSADGHPKS